MSTQDLARRRTEKVTGSDVSYYVMEIVSRSRGTFQVEVEDIIEALDMRFAEGNSLKAIVRGAKLRQDLGKPGSSKVYEAEKAVYYTKRMVARAEIRARLERASLMNLFGLDTLIVVDEPKRLPAYRVGVEEFIEALQPTQAEAATLRAIMTMCIIRRDHRDSANDELEQARRAAAAALIVKEEADV
jgi:hypothetical protein